MVMGTALLTYGECRVGKKIDWAANYVYGVYAAEHDLIMGESRQRIGAPSKTTGYSSLPRKGSPDNPFRL